MLNIIALAKGQTELNLKKEMTIEEKLANSPVGVQIAYKAITSNEKFEVRKDNEKLIRK